MQHYSYLLINIFTILFPVILSFDKKVHFFDKWKYVFPAILLSGIIFLVWDYIFTIKNVWSFNPDYVIGAGLFKLPVEEILFFLTVPFACLFIYECLNKYVPGNILKPYSNFIGITIFILCIGLILFFPGRIYTLVSMGFLALLLLYFHFIRKACWLPRFYLAFIVSLIPFYIVNGLLTSIPIVLYNDNQNIGMRVFTIPLEDHFYSMAMLILNTGIYEYFKTRNLANA